MHHTDVLCYMPRVHDDLLYAAYAASSHQSDQPSAACRAGASKQASKQCCAVLLGLMQAAPEAAPPRHIPLTSLAGSCGQHHTDPGLHSAYISAYITHMPLSYTV